MFEFEENNNNKKNICTFIAVPSTFFIYSATYGNLSRVQVAYTFTAQDKRVWLLPNHQPPAGFAHRCGVWLAGPTVGGEWAVLRRTSSINTETTTGAGAHMTPTRLEITFTLRIYYNRILVPILVCFENIQGFLRQTQWKCHGKLFSDSPDSHVESGEWKVDRQHNCSSVMSNCGLICR